MHISSAILRTLGGIFLSTGFAVAQAGTSPFYNPANIASPTGKTLAYEQYLTIGCPGRGILETPCKALAAALPADSDKDGVFDPADRCPDTPMGAIVDAQGCELDGDKDGVVDRLDQCPTTPPGRTVNNQGCELDGDGDGVVDALDRCPNTPAGRKVNAQGCELDSDVDGIVNALDLCPNTPPGRTVNAQGCEFDSDGDGVVNALDKCPNTPAGRTVNAQGCELDSDGDGVVDALDQCPNTPAGRKVNAQGCELDSDGDGIVDALDLCPNTPAGDRVNNQGCSLPNIQVLKGVNFDTAKASLKPESKDILDDAIATLKRYPGMKVEIGGHADSVGNDAYNMELSQKRVNTVMEFFISHGISSDRLSAKGYGETQPVADNGTAEGRAQNRRVELRAQN